MNEIKSSWKQEMRDQFYEKNHYCPQIYEFLKQLFSIKSIKMSDAYKGDNEFETRHLVPVDHRHFQTPHYLKIILR